MEEFPFESFDCNHGGSDGSEIVPLLGGFPQNQGIKAYNLLHDLSSHAFMPFE